MWQLMSASKDPELESTYSQLLRLPSIHEKAIIRDLNRTFPTHEFFNDKAGIGQNNLLNIMKAYSLYDDEVGYCQGMAFVVGPLLLNVGFFPSVLHLMSGRVLGADVHFVEIDARRRSILRARSTHEIVRPKITIYSRHARPTTPPIPIRQITRRTPTSSIHAPPSSRYQIINVRFTMVLDFISISIPT